ncbi:hypothetical protein bthur0013_60250 [Bacillus thuringiensis IBL 200]|nr:hypothetical protein bthur0013_60250 [Bacillus thuringiensis IBL 200]
MDPSSKKASTYSLCTSILVLFSLLVQTSKKLQVVGGAVFPE